MMLPGHPEATIAALAAMWLHRTERSGAGVTFASHFNARVLQRCNEGGQASPRAA